jgi:hypothetical protein
MATFNLISELSAPGLVGAVLVPSGHVVSCTRTALAITDLSGSRVSEKPLSTLGFGTKFQPLQIMKVESGHTWALHGQLDPRTLILVTFDQLEPSHRVTVPFSWLDQASVFGVDCLLLSGSYFESARDTLTEPRPRAVYVFNLSREEQHRVSAQVSACLPRSGGVWATAEGIVSLGRVFPNGAIQSERQWTIRGPLPRWFFDTDEGDVAWSTERHIVLAAQDHATDIHAWSRRVDRVKALGGLVVGGGVGRDVEVFEMGGRFSHSLEGHSGRETLAVDVGVHDGRMHVLAGGNNGSIRIWERA